MKNRLLTVAVFLLAALGAGACGTTEEEAKETPTTTTAMDHDATGSEATDHDATGSHEHDEVVDVSGLENPPTVAFTATPDGTGGVTLELAVNNLDLVPVNPPADHQSGQGHAHIYVDGASVAMVHETTVTINDLADGHHTIRVALSANDHRSYALGETVIADSLSVMTTGGSTAVAADHEISLEIMNGELMGGIQRLEMAVGEVAAITVTSDVDEILHIHAYNLTLDLMAGMPATLTVEANIPGVFEGELHHAGFQVLSLEVS